MRSDQRMALNLQMICVFNGKGSDSHHLRMLEMGSFVHKRVKSAVKRAEFVSDQMSYKT